MNEEYKKNKTLANLLLRRNSLFLFLFQFARLNILLKMVLYSVGLVSFGCAIEPLCIYIGQNYFPQMHILTFNVQVTFFSCIIFFCTFEKNENFVNPLPPFSAIKKKQNE